MVDWLGNPVKEEQICGVKARFPPLSTRDVLLIYTNYLYETESNNYNNRFSWRVEINYHAVRRSKTGGRKILWFFFHFETRR